MLTESQQRVSRAISKFLADENNSCFMLTGAGGSGKTFLTAKTLAEVPGVTFTAFTNKAVLMLRKTLENLGFAGDCKTIHVLLGLKPRVQDHSQRKAEIAGKRESNASTIYEHERLQSLLSPQSEDVEDSTEDDLLMFDYDYRKTREFPKVVVVDEFSMIPPELYVYLRSTQFYQHSLNNPLKYIFLGDDLQLPPIKHSTSVVLDEFKKNGWPLYKLPLQIMRSDSSAIAENNVALVKYMRGKMNPRTRLRSIVPNAEFVFSERDLVDAFVEAFDRESTSVLVATSNKCCERMSLLVQEKLDAKNGCEGREPDDLYEDCGLSYVKPMVWFMPGDLLCVTRMITVDSAEEEVTLFPGEQFEVLEASRGKVLTPFSQHALDGQILRVRIVGGDGPEIVLHNPDNLQARKARWNCKKRNWRSYKKYANCLQEFQKRFCVLVRGYAITCYKAQGSEYDKVFVNAEDIWNCVYRGNRLNYVLCMRNQYTAISRAKKRVVIFE